MSSFGSGDIRLVVQTLDPILASVNITDPADCGPCAHLHAPQIVID